MLTTAEDKARIEVIDRLIASGLRFLSFPPDLERAFAAESRAERVWLIRTSAVIAIVLYDITVFSDYRLMNDVFWQLVILKCLIITPLNILCILSIPFITRQAVLEFMFASLFVVSFAIPEAMIVVGHSPYRVLYQSATIYGLMYIGLVQRLSFMYTSLAVVSVSLILTVETWMSDAFDTQSYLPNLNYYGSGAILILFASYMLERGDRISYLWIKRAHLLNEVVNNMARTDPLTGLWNRRYLADIMEEARHDVGPTPVSAILIDIDHFKAFNDFSGHLQGDACLCAVGDCLKQVVAQSGGVAARFGGEEILVFLPGINADQAFAMAEQARAALHRLAVPHPALGDGRVVTASFGVATAMAPDFRPDALISAADACLYEAKRLGRDRVRMGPDPVAERVLPLAEAAA